MAENDLIVHDKLVHNSALVGIRLSGATRRSFQHNRLEKLETILKEERGSHRNCLIVIEGLYSTEGDVLIWPMRSRSRKGMTHG
jgi:8-amino-7-oxononanoate synthase